MDSLSLQEIAGNHQSVYESYLLEVSADKSGIIKALDAATFLRKSGLNQQTLKTIWDLSDPNCLGYLDKKSFFISLKLIAMVQNGQSLNINDLSSSFPAPIIGENVLSQIDWQISLPNIENYKTVYFSLNPIDGKLAGSKVKPYMMNSKLPVDVLTKVWDLSDIDQDGFLNMNEFILSCHLIAKATQGLSLPNQLPPELSNFNLMEINQPISQQFSPISPSPQPILLNEINVNNVSQWIVSAEDKIKYDQEFVKLDQDLDGFVNGLDVKDTLLQSGLAQNVLAHIWNLCDIKTNGMLNSEQFCLANYFIKQKQAGHELPLQLAPNMIPPTLRPKPTDLSNNIDSNSATALPKVSSTGNKELDIICEEIQQLKLEKAKYQEEVLSEETSLSLKKSEIKNIQNEVETLTQILKQLESQKNDASKRLDDFSSQLKQLEVKLHDLKTKFCLDNQKVDNLNQQYVEQKKSIEEQETDLICKRKEFEDLKNEEISLESKLTFAKSEAEQASKVATDTKLEISQLKTNFVELEEYERRVNERLNEYDNAIENQDIVKIASLLPRSITPPPFVTLESQAIDEFNADPFAGEDPFKDDDPFHSNKAPDAFGSDNFANFDAFGNGNKTSNDSFGFSQFDSFNSKDAFRSESPTPALPPKKSKPPPRPPAPSKNSSNSSNSSTSTNTNTNTSTSMSTSNKTPSRAAPPPPGKGSADQSTGLVSNFDPFNDNRDPFGSDAFSSQSFANFANFDKA